MADCGSLLDEELSSFVFSYLTENSDNQYGEEEVPSDRLGGDFLDIDLSQLDASDFDSVNCLSELHWCNDQSDGSPASINYSTGDELFETEDENAALLAALTDSLDGMVEDEVGGLSVFPSLGEEPDQEEDGDQDLPLDARAFSQSPGAETEDPSLLKKLLLTPPNLPTGIGHRHSNKSLHLRPFRTLVKSDAAPLQRKPRAVPPAGRLCTELHRHLTTARHSQDTAASASPVADDSEEDEEEEEEEEEDSDSEEEEEEEESSSSEAEGAPVVPAQPAEPQFSSEKELRSVVELIRYMHTYCLPTRKQAGWERKEREAPGLARRARPDPARGLQSRAGVPPGGATAPPPRRAPFSRRREFKADSLLKQLLEQTDSPDVSKPYRLHSPLYAPPTHSAKPGPPAHSQPSAAASRPVKAEPRDKDSAPGAERTEEAEPQSPGDDDDDDGGGPFSVRRSRRLASFPSRFGKRARPGRERGEGGNADGSPALGVAETDSLCCHSEKRVCLCLPLNPKSTGDSQYGTKTFELSVDLCGTAGLTPPTTPPHKPAEDEIFKPEGGKAGGAGGGSGGAGGGGGVKGSWLSRVHPLRKQPEQTELYAQLRRVGPVADGDDDHARGGALVHRTFGDHDYCVLTLGQSRKRAAAMLEPALRRSPEEAEEEEEEKEEPGAGEGPGSKGDAGPADWPAAGRDVASGQSASVSACPARALDPQGSEEDGEPRPSLPRSPSPLLHCTAPDSPASKTDSESSENSEACHSEDKQRSKLKSVLQIEEDNCQVFYIHNLPSSVTQTMLRKRFEAFGSPQECKVIIKNEERCGVIKIRQSGAGQKHCREPVFQGAGVGMRRMSRKRYIDLDEAGPGPVKSKYDALDFDTLLKEAQKSLHR
ncbi:peroxisome proliferator-activated receptor gamma coactivator 1-beta [Aplochiton taeniatus]